MIFPNSATGGTGNIRSRFENMAVQQEQEETKRRDEERARRAAKEESERKAAEGRQQKEAEREVSALNSQSFLDILVASINL